jgi:hypothetical protein
MMLFWKGRSETCIGLPLRNAPLPRSAWKKLKALLMDDPQTAPLATLSRRIFLPAEVLVIFSVLGEP